MGEIYLAFEVLVVLMMVAVACLALVAAVGARLKSIFSPGVRTAVLRIVFGGIWMADALLRFLPGAYPQLSYWMVVMAGDGQPPWFSGWFSFWTGTVAGDPAFWWYGIGVIELSLACCLFIGFLRRPAYLLGLALSLFLWTVPQGFGGPYGPGSTDMGTGILYAVVFLALLHLDSVSGPPRLAFDAVVGRRWLAWSWLVQAKASAPVGGPTR